MAQRYFLSGSSPLAWPVQQGADGAHDGLHSRPDPSAHLPAHPLRYQRPSLSPVPVATARGDLRGVQLVPNEASMIGSHVYSVSRMS